MISSWTTFKTKNQVAANPLAMHLGELKTTTLIEVSTLFESTK